MSNNKLSIQQYVINAINPTEYGVKADTPAKKVKFLLDCFESEYWHEYNRQRFKNNKTAAIADWLSGLPSSIDIVFYYHDIRKKGIALGLISKTATEKQFETFEQNWFKLLAKTIHELESRNSKGLKKPVSKGLTTLCAKTVGVIGRRKKDGTQKKGFVAAKGGGLKPKKKATSTQKK